MTCYNSRSMTDDMKSTSDESVLARNEAAENECLVEMVVGRRTCRRPIRHAPADLNERPVCLMHSKDPRKAKGELFEAFSREFEAILEAAGASAAHFEGFSFPELDLKGRSFESSCQFAGAFFLQDADFTGATFIRRADFFGANFKQGANFHKVTFNAESTFQTVVFKSSANFIDTEFGGRANFFEATFTQGADFVRATFGDGASFDGATFMTNANFGGAQFWQHASFVRTTYSGDATVAEVAFAGIEFHEGAAFNHAVFRLETDFEGTIFSEKASFRGATFGEKATFDNAIFKIEATFTKTTFTKNANFAGTQFRGSANWEASRFLESAAFRRTKFDLQLAEVPSAVFGLASFDYPGKIVFDDVDLGRVSFHNCDVSEVWFTSSVRWEQRANHGYAVVEESVPLDQEIGKGLQRNGERDYEAVAQIYQQLKKNYDTRLDYWTANKFHFSEMEMKRLVTPSGQHLLGLRRWAHRWLSLTAWYCYASGYGNSYRKPILWLLAVLLLFAGLFPLPGVGLRRSGASYTEKKHMVQFGGLGVA